MEIAKTKCCTNNKSKKINAGDGASMLTTALLILAPKCPFCVMAYTGSILMFFDIESSAIMPYVQHIKPALGALILLIIVLNNRGRKTAIALSIGITAMILLLLSNYSMMPVVPEWLLYCTFFFAAWYNGNFEFFYRFL
ncbi:MAG: hypothetical protein R3356_01340, partial [Eudoraea sp.]|nr:hypothetical protein [Eudoraea sp.]